MFNFSEFCQVVFFSSFTKGHRIRVAMCILAHARYGWAPACHINSLFLAVSPMLQFFGQIVDLHTYSPYYILFSLQNILRGAIKWPQSQNTSLDRNISYVSKNII